MSQFVNRYNMQNGAPPMDVQQMSQNMQGQGYNDVWQPQTIGIQSTGQGMMQPDTMGWKSYSAPPSKPVSKPTMGRWVESFDDIAPQEVKMDGCMYFFPQNDYSCIYARYWDRNGQLRTFRFLPEKIEEPDQPCQSDINDILRGYEAISTNVSNRLDALDKRMDDIYRLVSQPQSTSKTRSKTIEKEEM